MAQAVERREVEIAEADANADREYAERMRMKEHMRRAHGMDDRANLRAAMLVAATLQVMGQKTIYR